MDLTSNDFLYLSGRSVFEPRFAEPGFISIEHYSGTDILMSKLSLGVIPPPRQWNGKTLLKYLPL